MFLNMLWGTSVATDRLSCQTPLSGCHARHLLLLLLPCRGPPCTAKHQPQHTLHRLRSQCLQAAPMPRAASSMQPSLKLCSACTVVGTAEASRYAGGCFPRCQTSRAATPGKPHQSCASHLQKAPPLATSYRSSCRSAPRVTEIFFSLHDHSPTAKRCTSARISEA